MFFQFMEHLAPSLPCLPPPRPFRITGDAQSPNCARAGSFPGGWRGACRLRLRRPVPPPWLGPAGRSSVPILKAGPAVTPFPTGGSMILTSESNDSQELEPSELVEELSDSWPGAPPLPPPHHRRRRLNSHSARV